MILNWNVPSKEDAALIRAIASRAVAMYHARGLHYSMLTAHMDITAVHTHGNPLRLRELLDADDYEFAHDIGGIRRHINRNSGKLEDGFLPRYSAEVKA